MKIFAKFAFVLLVGAFVVFGGSTSAKADSSGTCTSNCGTIMGYCGAYCQANYNPAYSGFTQCINQCQTQWDLCKAACSN